MTDTAETDKKEVPLIARILLGVTASSTTSWMLTFGSLHGIDFTTLGISSEVIKSTITGGLTGVFVAPECIPLAIAGCILSLRLANRTIKNALTKDLPPEGETK